MTPLGANPVGQRRGKGSLAAQVSYQNIDLSNDDDYEYALWSLAGAVGYFFTDHFEVNLAPIIFMIDPDEGDETTTYSVLGNAKYNFYQEGWTVVPYLGVQAGVSGYEREGDDDSAFSYGGMAGTKVFVTEDVSLNFELNYLYTQFDEDDGGNELDSTTISFFVGFAWYFGG